MYLGLSLLLIYTFLKLICDWYLCIFAGEQQPGLNIITEYVIGYLYPERPVANMCFKVYGYISMNQGLTFLADFKLGHYMKIPLRAMFMAQVSFILPVFNHV